MVFVVGVLAMWLSQSVVYMFWGEQICFKTNKSVLRGINFWDEQICIEMNKYVLRRTKHKSTFSSSSPRPAWSRLARSSPRSEWVIFSFSLRAKWFVFQRLNPPPFPNRLLCCRSSAWLSASGSNSRSWSVRSRTSLQGVYWGFCRLFPSNENIIIIDGDDTCRPLGKLFPISVKDTWYFINDFCWVKDTLFH